MKVLFICSGNNGGPSVVVANQAKSLININVRVNFYFIQGKGLAGYLNNIFLLRRHLRENEYDIFHAHYSLSAFVASLAGARPLIVSLMGSDVNNGVVHRLLIRISYFLFSWKAIIAKSEEIKNLIGIHNTIVVPNGVNISFFKPYDKHLCMQQLGWDPNKTHILFAADHRRKEKNFLLAKSAIDSLSAHEVILHYLGEVSHNIMPLVFNASDVVVLSSLWEGSPNVVKEAMACNCPIVATDVGDIKWLFNNENGHFISEFDTDDMIRKIEFAISFSKEKVKTNGRQRIITIGLDDITVAEKILNFYYRVLTER
jgi:teichuronic acid biosynthesis glycosyltransferase TuaC